MLNTRLSNAAIGPEAVFNYMEKLRGMRATYRAPSSAHTVKFVWAVELSTLGHSSLDLSSLWKKGPKLSRSDNRAARIRPRQRAPSVSAETTVTVMFT